MSTYTVPERQLSRLAELVGKLGRRAARLGVPAPRMNVLERTLTTATVELANTEVALPGWVLIAKAELADPERPEKGTVLVRLPGAAVAPEARYNGLPLVCEHCNASRRRNASYVVLEASTGQQREVGSSCLADYTGHQDAERLAAFLEAIGAVLGAFEEAAGERRKGERPSETTYALEDVLALTSRVVGARGWVPAHRTDASPTRNLVTVLLTKPTAELNPRLLDEVSRQPADVDGVERAIEWAAELPDAQVTNDWLANVRTLAQAGVVRRRHLGIAVSILEAYRQRNRGRGHGGGFVGQLGQPVEVAGKLVCHHPYPSGTRIEVETDEGQAVLWWPPFHVAPTTEVGGRVRLRGEVKKHDEHNGKRITLLTRAALEPESASTTN